MKTMRMILVATLLSIVAMQGFATEHAFMGFDVSTQKMYAVVVGDQPFHAEITYTQSNPDGYIGPETTYVPAPVEIWGEAPLSPTDPDRFTDIPDGTLNIITAYVDIYDAPDGEFLYRQIVTDTLVADVNGPVGVYTYRDGECVPVLPDTIRHNSSFCAFICHGSFTVPIFCEDPSYNPDLLEVTVSNGCNPTETHCSDAECPRLEWSEFRWFKRVFSGCRLYLTMTYCNAAPGCVCIWRSDRWLPVEVLSGSFRAVAGDEQVHIGWVTASESGNNTFVVTRSETRDGVYLGVHSVAAEGSASGHSYTWTDTDVDNGKTYFYKLHAIDADGNHYYSDADGRAVVVSATPGLEPVPTEYAISNYPNPFNSQTTFAFTLPLAGHVSLKVFDLLGREVATLADREMEAGSHTLNWSADGLSAGVYMYTLQSGDFSQAHKLLYLK